MPSISIASLTEADIPGAIECIQLAFSDDPYNNWVFDRATQHTVIDAQFSLARNRQSLRTRCVWGINNAIFVVAKDAEAESDTEGGEVLGVAMWMPPQPSSTRQGWYEWWQGWVLWGRQIMVNLQYGRGGLNVKQRYYIWKEAQRAAQSELWTDPKGYYFCNIVTVLPHHQGKGIGKLLFKHVTDRADAEGKRCYLESSRDKPNTEIYVRMGFAMAKEMLCDDRGDVCKVSPTTTPWRTASE
ncbi:MAG: hypothetical protein LQ340_006709 [Diploschistes diacapsis]|nr:MAG: hypothetical protein LQ340_006709 [Diploschistes diacapsis]